MPYDLLIVGGGPAGASAAIFAARAQLSTAVIDEDKGMTRRAMLWNHLGFPNGITGPELVDLGREQAERSGASWIEGKVASLTVRDDLVVAEVNGSPLEARDVLLTLGANPSMAADSGIATQDGTEPHINRTITVDAEGRTNVAHVWAAGTAAGVSVHTIITAGDGARVAVNIISALKGARWADHDVLPKPT